VPAETAAQSVLLCVSMPVVIASSHTKRKHDSEVLLVSSRHFADNSVAVLLSAAWCKHTEFSHW
jgi:hypothetical protein